MADKPEDAKEKKAEESEVASTESIPEVTTNVDIDLDDDLAVALGDSDDSASAQVDVDKLIGEADPDFSSELAEIASADFSNVKIEEDSAAEAVDETSKAPSMLRAYFDNIPKDRKNRYLAALIFVLISVPIAVLILMGKILPSFDLPYYLSMDEMTEKVHVYDMEEDKIPLFDSFRNNTVTSPLPKTMINLRSEGDEPVYGQFEFFLVLRDKEVAKVVQNKQTEIIDLVQRILEQVSWEELKNPLGKERVKKVIRHQLNEYFQGNFVVGVYYRSILLQK